VIPQISVRISAGIERQTPNLQAELFIARTSEFT
jgi:hypothetical protein